MIKIRSNLPTILYVLLIIVGWAIISYYFQPSPKPTIEIQQLNQLQEKSIEIIIEMNKLLISLSLLVIGGIGGFLLQKYQTLKIESLIQIVIVVLSMMFAVSSIYFGYVLYAKLVEMLSNSMFDISTNLIEEPQKFQFFSFLLSVILFGLFVFNQIVPNAKGRQNQAKKNKRKTEEHKNDDKN